MKWKRQTLILKRAPWGTMSGGMWVAGLSQTTARIVGATSGRFARRFAAIRPAIRGDIGVIRPAIRRANPAEAEAEQIQRQKQRQIQRQQQSRAEGLRCLLACLPCLLCLLLLLQTVLMKLIFLPLPLPRSKTSFAKPSPISGTQEASPGACGARAR